MKKIPYFTVIYEDDFIIAVNKAPGISVCPDRYDREKKNLFELLQEVKRKRLWMVHRIDLSTSGLVVFAKSAAMHQKLSTAFERRTVQKTYITVVWGRPQWKDTVCDLALVPNGNKMHQTIVDRYQGKKSITVFTSICSCGNYTVVEAKPQTGRTHQIRVHAAALGSPVLCDPLYGTSKPIKLSDFKKNFRGDRFEEQPLLSRLALHAAKLELPLFGNRTGEAAAQVVLEAPLPRDMSALINQLKKNV
ncbi:MAG: RluA family pseudouridine synthase [Termitinemataceae bacterium]|nr:MAG: RluA family pseudouridine synthase [Termitinemataceae bacterium]